MLSWLGSFRLPCRPPGRLAVCLAGGSGWRAAPGSPERRGGVVHFVESLPSPSQPPPARRDATPDLTYRGRPLRCSGRAGHPSRDSDLPAPGCLVRASRLGMGADAARLSRRSARAWRVREGVAGWVRSRGDAGIVMRFRWPDPRRAWPHWLSLERAGGKIQSDELAAWRPSPFCYFFSSLPVSRFAGVNCNGGGYTLSRAAARAEGFLIDPGFRYWRVTQGPFRLRGFPSEPCRSGGVADPWQIAASG